MSGKKLAILTVIVGLGAFIAVQAIFGFPIKDLIRKSVTDEAKAVTKDQRGTCVVEPSDHRPRVSQIVHTR
ncbi:MAG: hypothetical protein ACJ72U_06835 [Nitrososphaeraceae archaeon]|jgi:hypothetical protein